MIDEAKEASMVGVTTVDTGTSPDMVLLMVAGGNATLIAYLGYSPNDARRFALRILQTCELAEGKAPVNG